MFSKKKKDPKTEPAGAPAAGGGAGETQQAAPAESAAAPGPAPGPEASEPQSGGLLSSGLGSKAKTPNISASRLGGRPPSRPPAPEPVRAEPAPAQATPPSSPPAAQPAATASVHSMPPAQSEGEMSRSGRMPTMRETPGLPQTALALEDAGPDGRRKVKNPYKMNPLFDVLLPVSLSVILCGGFAATIKIVKDKHAIYGYTDAEKKTQVRIQSLADAKIMDDVKKMDPEKLLDSGDTAGAIAAAKTLGSKAAALAEQKGMSVASKNTSPSKEELAEEEKAVRDLLAAGMVLCQAGSKQEKETGLTYMSKAADVATYSKYVRLLFARELVRAHKDEEAIKQYEDITTLFKDKWSLPHKELGLLYMRANLGDKAVEELTAVAKADPQDPSIQRQLGLAMAQNGDQQAGFEEFQKGFTREGDVLSYPAAVKPLVDAHSGLVDATLQDVKKASEKNPTDVKLQLDLARLYIATGKFKDARDLMEKARKSQDTNPEVHEVMSEIMCRQSQAQSGFDEFRSAVQNLHLAQ